LAVHPEWQKVRVAWFRAWAPTHGKKEVYLPEVEETVEKIARLFRVEWLGYDPNQATLLSQRLTKCGIPMKKVPFVGKNLHEMADSLKQVIDQGKLEAYDDFDGRLRADLGKLMLEEKSYGFKLTAVSDKTGHADVATALVIALPHALSIMDTAGRLPSDHIIWEPEGATAEELESMPDELKDIMELGDENIGNFRRPRRPRRRPSLRDWMFGDDDDD